MPRGRVHILDNSVHVKFILDCIEKGYSMPKIQKLLLEKGFKVSLPTISDYVKRVKRQGLNLNKFRVDTENTALEVNKKIQDIKELSNIFNRRNYLIQTLMNRRDRLIQYAAEGPRTGHVISKLEELLKLIDCSKKELPAETYLSMESLTKYLQKYVQENFLDEKCYPSIEDAIRKNTMDVHELCKYIEQWTSRYEVESLLEKLCEGLTKAAVNTFGPLLKSQTEEYRKQYVEKFLSEVDALMSDLKSYQLDLEEQRHG